MPNKMKKIISALLILAAASTSFANDIAKYKDSADKGNPQSQLALGILYMTGKGGATQNPALALEYIKKAAGETGLEFRRNNGPEIARICFAKCTVHIEGFKANIFFLPV